MQRRIHLKGGAAAMAALPVFAAQERSLILLSKAEAARLMPGELYGMVLNQWQG
jgi:hypothetical protein